MRVERNALVLCAEASAQDYFTNADTRELVFRFVRERHEPQYLVNDSPSMQAVADEVVQLGGKLELRGEIDNHPYYLIHW